MLQDVEISLSGNLTLEDFIKYNHYRMNKILKLYVAVSFIVIFLILQIAMSGSFLLLSSLLYLFSEQLKKRQSIKEYESDPLIKQMIHYPFNAEGIDQVVRNSNNQYEWDDFFKARENQALFLLYLSKNKAIIIPKRFFDSQNQMNAFKHLVSENINKFEMNAD